MQRLMNKWIRTR